MLGRAEELAPPPSLRLLDVGAAVSTSDVALGLGGLGAVHGVVLASFMGAPYDILATPYGEDGVWVGPPSRGG